VTRLSTPYVSSANKSNLRVIEVGASFKEVERPSSVEYRLRHGQHHFSWIWLDCQLSRMMTGRRPGHMVRQRHHRGGDTGAIELLRKGPLIFKVRCTPIMKDQDNRYRLSRIDGHENTKRNNVVRRKRAHNGARKLLKIFGAFVGLIDLAPRGEGDGFRRLGDTGNFRKWDVLRTANC